MITPDLGGLLSRPPRPKPKPAGVPSDVRLVEDFAPEVAEVAPPTPSPRLKPAAPAPSAAVRAAVASPSTYGRNVTLYMPAEVDRAMRAALEGSPTSLTRFILSAVNKQHGRLGEWLRPDIPGPDDLFAIPQPAVRSGPTARTTVRLTEEQLTAVDSLAARFAVPRTRVLVAAIRAELGMSPDSSDQ